MWIRPQTIIIHNTEILRKEEISCLLLELHHSPNRNQQVSFQNPWSASSHHAPSPIALSPQFPPTKHTQSRWAHGCIHLPLSHHNTLFKLDTARSLFFLAELIEPVRPDLPYQSVKGIFHSLQYKTQCPSVVRFKEGHTVCVTQGAKQSWCVDVGSTCTVASPYRQH